ncbi:MAG TPA: symmetrical bis(5'-nucleosyl)-tetraphosphatase [Methylophilaceae bacterium]|nr:symmetrical bis(5'-nucleosyl)-tetraphosphatase [Methylophilaceae bacterium]
MSTYAIGDLQGCYHAFQDLLQKINFNPRTDKIWLVGDLINRGSGSLEVLRWVYQHRSNVVAVLGNHDLHALVVAEGFVAAHRSDTLQDLLAAPDRDELLTWLRHQSMVHYEHGYLMVHAGLLPQWTVEQALALGAEVEAALRSDGYRDFLVKMYGNQPAKWSNTLTGIDRLRVITNAMTRLRICTDKGEMEFKFKGELEDIGEGYMPWFEVPARKSRNNTIIFGHWSALGLQQRENLFALDTGCLWGGQLTALRLEDRQLFQVDSNPQDSTRSIHEAG